MDVVASSVKSLCGACTSDVFARYKISSHNAGCTVAHVSFKLSPVILVRKLRLRFLKVPRLKSNEGTLDLLQAVKSNLE
jgi:hypothetical protein